MKGATYVVKRRTKSIVELYVTSTSSLSLSLSLCVCVYTYVPRHCSHMLNRVMNASFQKEKKVKQCWTLLLQMATWMIGH